MTRVAELLIRAVDEGVDAALVAIENFDEAMRGLVNLCDGVDDEALSGFALDGRSWSPAPQSPGRGTWPVVRLNALPVEPPTQCRRVDCESGGTTEVREAAEGINPRTVFEGVTDENKAAAADFARERTVRRYNSVLNDLLDFWSGFLAEGQEDLRALGIGDGVDAAFQIGGTTAFSRRAFT